MRRIILTLTGVMCVLLTACSIVEVNNIERFNNAIQEELVNKDFHHIEETIIQTMNGVTTLEQERQLYYCDGKFYVENVQNDNMFIYGMKYGIMEYISQSRTPDEIEWVEIQKSQSLEAYKSWFLTLEKEAFAFKEEYISIEEKADGYMVTYDRSQEATSNENEVNTVKETYYFDKKWNLIKTELITEGMMALENGLSGKIQYIITTQFMDTSKKDISNKIEDVYKNIK